jgi:hypothetical protein
MKRLYKNFREDFREESREAFGGEALRGFGGAGCEESDEGTLREFQGHKLKGV